MTADWIVSRFDLCGTGKQYPGLYLTAYITIVMFWVCSRND